MLKSEREGSSSLELDFKGCWARALELLARRPYSEWKLKKKLRERFCDSVITEVVEQLRSRKFIDDQEIARQKMRGWARKAKSPQIYSQLLARENISVESSFIEAFLCEERIDPKELLRTCYKKLYESSRPDADEDPEQFLRWKAKALRGLQSKGYSWEECMHIPELCG